MAVALAYSTAFPVFAFPLLLLAVAVGVSRICLGVHYPGDVVMGQLIALVTGAAILSA
jgi:undecaprenyl-diphosphatase